MFRALRSNLSLMRNEGVGSGKRVVIESPCSRSIGFSQTCITPIPAKWTAQCCAVPQPQVHQ